MNEYSTRLRIEILKIIESDNEFTRKQLTKEIHRRYGELGSYHLQLFWRNGLIGYCKFNELRLTKKGFIYLMNMEESLSKREKRLK